MLTNLYDRIADALILCIGITSTFYIFQFAGIPLFVWLCIPILLCCSITLKVRINLWILVYISSLLITACIACISGIYINAQVSIRSTIIMVIVFSFGIILYNFSKNKRNIFIKGVNISCYIQVIWCILQYILYNIFNLDINDYLFKEKLQLVEQASRYVSGEMVVSGLCWHPSNLIPVFIIMMFLNINKWYLYVIWCWIVINAHNSTLLIGYILYTIGSIFYYLHKKNKLYYILPIIFLCIILLLGTNLLNAILSNIILTYNRIFNPSISGNTDSNMTHIRYYVSLLDIWGHSNLANILFGFGYTCSGYPFSKLYGQYTNLQTWSVESNLMDSIYGTGIIGTFVYYWWYIKNVIKGLKVDFRYFLLFITMFICGITYNNQIGWVILVELIIANYINRKDNILYCRKEFNDEYCHNSIS